MSLPDAPADRHRVVAAGFGDRVRGTRDWDAPAPVEGWTARSVVDHLTSWFPHFLASGAGIELPAADPDPVVAWQAQTDAVQALIEDPAGRGLPNPPIRGGPPGEGGPPLFPARGFL